MPTRTRRSSTGKVAPPRSDSGPSGRSRSTGGASAGTWANPYWTELLAQPSTVYQIGLPPNRIDILGSVRGVGFDEALARSRTDSYNGIPVRFIGLRDLITAKTGTGRKRDAADVEVLRRVLARTER